MTLSVLSVDQILAQGFEITYGDNKCKISYMFYEGNKAHDGKGKEVEEDTSDMIEKHNKFLKDYFKFIDPPQGRLSSHQRVGGTRLE